MINLKDITSKVTAISKEAGNYLRISQATFNKDQVTSKSLNALVSDVDRTAEKLLVHGLAHYCQKRAFLPRKRPLNKILTPSIRGLLTL